MFTGIVCFLLLLVALLAIPVTLTFQVSHRQIFQGQITLVWLFGLIHICIPIPQNRLPASENRPKTAGLHRYSRNRVNLLKLIRNRPFRRRMFRYASDMWHAIQKRNIRLHIRLGLGDPAETGQLWAILGPVLGVLVNAQETSLEVEPEFIDAVFELDGSGTIRIIPLQLLYLTSAMLLSPSVWQVIRRVR